MPGLPKGMARRHTQEGQQKEGQYEECGGREKACAAFITVHEAPHQQEHGREEQNNRQEHDHGCHWSHGCDLALEVFFPKVQIVIPVLAERQAGRLRRAS